MGNLTTALAIVLSISAMLILGGIIGSDLAGTDKTIMSCKGTLFNNCTSTSYTLDSSNMANTLPNSNVNTISPSGVSSDSGIFAVIGSWLADVTGISFIYNIISGPSTFLKSIGLPNIYADIFATIWYSLTLFLIITWWKGNDG